MKQELNHPVHEFVLPPWAAAIAENLNAYHPPTFEHSRRVAIMTHALWEDYKSQETNRGRVFHITASDMFAAGLLHDAGKLDVPTEILDKPGPLDEGEKEIVVRHTEGSYERVKDYDLPIARIVRGHHSWGKNGLVYDHELAKTDDAEIEEAQRIMAIADKIDTSYHRGPDGHMRTVEEVADYIFVAFEAELKSGVIEQNQLHLALGYTQLIAA